MTEPKRLGELFDPKADLSISEHCRPHWSQAGAIVFITLRTADSIPQEVLDRWEREKRDWMRRHDCPVDRHWSEVLPTLEPAIKAQFKKTFNRCREDFLDTCHGACVLRKRELAKIVADTLLHFDGERYRLGDFIVMPNHVHLLAAFPSEDTMGAQCDSWTHYSAWKINLALGRKGKFGGKVSSGNKSPLTIWFAVPSNTSICANTFGTMAQRLSCQRTNICIESTDRRLSLRESSECMATGHDATFAERKATMLRNSLSRHSITSHKGRAPVTRFPRCSHGYHSHKRSHWPD